MPRYIDADKAPSVMKEMPLGKQCIDAVMKMVIDRLPTEDVVEVVRCKDCRYCEECHYEEEGEKPYIKLKCKWSNYSHQPNDYCSIGERRESNGRE